ncbi:DUF4260 domain-containing protein [Ornithinibacillus halotolerans]|uniref:DUF4260 domain-containing protein n=1 Tax=Ornithinibacillus halotolerans TaxID=1274357 RepID=UPI0016684C71|nr:DUF4260 domain-containing protein [Ornithinibacillus halotolerans]
MVKTLLHIEGFAVFAFCLFIYGYNEFNWLLFFILLLAPDISMLGYLHNPRTGAMLYNIFHTYVTPLIVIFIAFLFSYSLILAIGIIWMAHIGMDRMVGYGLKYPQAFKDTHLNRV